MIPERVSNEAGSSPPAQAPAPDAGPDIARRWRPGRQAPGHGLALSLSGLVLVAVVPLLLLASAVAWLVIQQKQDAMASELQGVARALQVAVDRELQSPLQALQLLATSSSLARHNMVEFSARAAEALQARQGWLDLLLVDAAQAVVVARAGGGPAPALSPETRLALDRVVAGQGPQFTGVQRLGGSPNGWAVMVLAPVMQGEKLAHVLVLVLDPLPMSSLFVDQHLAGSWTGAILDQNLNLVGRSRDAARLLGRPATDTLAKRLRSSQTGMFMATNQEGESVYTAFSRSPLTGWSVALGAPAAEVEGPTHRLLAQLALGGSLAMGLALVLAARVGKDIVRRRHADEQALQQSAAQLNLALGGAELVTWDWHLPSGRLVCSDAWPALMGDSPGTLPSHMDDWRKRIHPDDLPASEAALAQVLNGQSALFNTEYRVRWPDGRWIWVLVRGKVVSRQGDGRADRVSGMALDVTQRRHAQQAAEQDHVRLQTILATAREGIHILDADGLLVEANPAFLHMLGLDASAVGKRHASDWDPDITPENFKRRLAAALRHADQRLLEATHRRADGQLLQVELSLSRMTIDGQPLVCVASRDVTQRKHNEAELDKHRQHLEALVASRTTDLAAARDAAEAANRAKSVFLANMSHELRTPLAGAMGMTELALRRATDPRQIEHLNKSLAAARHLLGVIGDVLDIARIEAGRLQLREENFNLAELVQAAVGPQAPAAAAKGLTLRVELSPELPVQLRGDALRLQQILANFISNAVKFSAQGEVQVRLEPSPPRAGQATARAGPGLWLRLAVTDQGQGITPAAQERLFQPFSQADSSSTRSEDGAGLGLVIARHLAELMDGEAGVLSRPGQGSTFWATVRLAPARQEPEPSPAPEATLQALNRQFGGARVLLVDDNPVNREVASALLALAGLVVDQATDGHDALRQARQGAPGAPGTAGGGAGGGAGAVEAAPAAAPAYALVLMDVQMPRMNGHEAARALRRLPGYETVPILAMTAGAFDENRAECLASGMNDHIAKPFEVERLYATVLAWLQHGAGTGPQALRDIANSSRALSDTPPGHSTPDNQR